MRIMRHGQGKTFHEYKDKGNSYMSGLRQSFLEQLRILGNHSGCHQLPERSFFYHGKQFPVCARCTGVTIGQLAAVIFRLAGKHTGSGSALLLLSLMGADWLIQALHIKSSNNCRRLITGIAGGFGLFTLYLNGASFLFSLIFKKNYS